MEKLETLSDRLNYAITLTGTKKADLARAINVKPQVIQFLCGSKTQSSRFTFEIATALGLNTQWFATGKGEMFLSDDPRHKLSNEFTRLPVLPIDQVTTVINNHHQIDSEFDKAIEWVAVPSHVKNTVVIRMPDASMEPLLPNSAILLIKKIKDYSPQDGDILLMLSQKYNTAFIRKLICHHDQFILQPENLDFYKPIEFTEDLNVLGVVAECHFKIKK